MQLLGIDFTSAPRRVKPITVARGRLDAGGARVTLERVDALADFAAFEALLREPGPWLGGFDFPFGLPREFVESQQLGRSSDEVIDELRARCARRMDFRALVDDWGNARPAGQRRLLHRRTDHTPDGVTSTSPLQTRYVPVGFMYFEGFGRLVDAGVTIPGLRDGDATRVAVEAYPGLLAHELIKRRSYKNSAQADRLVARNEILDTLERGCTRLDLSVALTPAHRDALARDASGDKLDALLCLVQAAWASARPGYGLPEDIDPLEGWIVTAEARGSGGARAGSDGPKGARVSRGR